MYIVQLAPNHSYNFVDKAEADKFATLWGAKAEYKSICGDPNCHCETPCKSFHFIPRSLGEGGSLETSNRQPVTVLGHEQEDYQLNN